MLHFLVAFTINFGNNLVCNQMLLGKRLIRYSFVLTPNSRIVKIPICFSTRLLLVTIIELHDIRENITINKQNQLIAPHPYYTKYICM